MLKEISHGLVRVWRGAHQLRGNGKRDAGADAAGLVDAHRELWRAAGALASSMVATVAALAFLTFVIPDTQVATISQASPNANGYSAEEVILDQAQSDEVSDGQLLTTIYDGDEETR